RRPEDVGRNVVAAGRSTCRTIRLDALFPTEVTALSCGDDGGHTGVGCQLLPNQLPHHHASKSSRGLRRRPEDVGRNVVAAERSTCRTIRLNPLFPTKVTASSLVDQSGYTDAKRHLPRCVFDITTSSTDRGLRRRPEDAGRNVVAAGRSTCRTIPLYPLFPTEVTASSCGDHGGHTVVGCQLLPNQLRHHHASKSSRGLRRRPEDVGRNVVAAGRSTTFLPTSSGRRRSPRLDFDA